MKFVLAPEDMAANNAVFVLHVKNVLDVEFLLDQSRETKYIDS